MSFLGGFRVEILVEGVDNREYNNPSEPSDPKQRYRYIEAKHDAKFLVRVTLTQDVVFLAEVLTCAISIDGETHHWTRWPKPPQNMKNPKHHLDETYDGVQDKGNHHEWKFDLKKSKAGDPPKITQIGILFRHGDLVSADQPVSLDEYPEDLETTGLSDTVGVNPAVRRAQSLAAEVERVGGVDDCYFFKFSCCEKSVLEELGIVSSA